MMNKDSKIYIAGHNGMVGSSIKKELLNQGYRNLIYKSSNELDLRNNIEVEKFFQNELPEYVFLAAAKVGGILANSSNKANFIYDNIMINTNVIHNSYKFNVTKLLFLGSSCIYPKEACQPIKEEYLLTGPLEETNDAYAIAKIAGIKMCESYRSQYGCNFISAMPCNLYGKNDNYDLKSSHVIPALINKFHDALVNNLENVTIWGSGEAYREFMIVDDLANASLFLMNNYNEFEHINVGYGSDIKISELVDILKDIIGYTGNIIYDTSKPNGTYRKLMSSDKINNMGWYPSTSLEEGLKKTYNEYKLLKNNAEK